MKPWNVSGDGKPWKVGLDVRDLGGHLDDGSRMPRMGLLLLARFSLGLRLNWALFGVSICRLACMLLRCRMCLLPP